MGNCSTGGCSTGNCGGMGCSTGNCVGGSCSVNAGGNCVGGSCSVNQGAHSTNMSPGMGSNSGQNCVGGVCSVRNNNSGHPTATNSIRIPASQAASVAIDPNEKGYNILKDGVPLEKLKYCDKQYPRKNICAQGKDGKWYKVLTQEVAQSNGQKTKELLLANGEKLKDTPAKQEYACLYNRWIDSGAWKLSDAQRADVKKSLASLGTDSMDCNHVPPSPAPEHTGDFKIGENGAIDVNGRRVKFAVDNQTGDVTPIDSSSHEPLSEKEQEFLKQKSAEIIANKNEPAKYWLAEQGSYTMPAGQQTPKQIIAASVSTTPSSPREILPAPKDPSSAPNPSTPSSYSTATASTAGSGLHGRGVGLNPEMFQPTLASSSSMVANPTGRFKSSPLAAGIQAASNNSAAGPSAEQIAARQEKPAATEKGPKHALIKFSASWCGPCQQIENAKIMSKLGKKYEKTALTLDKDFDANPDLAKAFKVESLPAFILVSIDPNNPNDPSQWKEVTRSDRNTVKGTTIIQNGKARFVLNSAQTEESLSKIYEKAQ